MAHEFDVVVVGSGIAGLSAAISALESGARVAVIERATPEESGGNTRYTEAFLRMETLEKPCGRPRGPAARRPHGPPRPRSAGRRDGRPELVVAADAHARRRRRRDRDAPRRGGAGDARVADLARPALRRPADAVPHAGSPAHVAGRRRLGAGEDADRTGARARRAVLLRDDGPRPRARRRPPRGRCAHLPRRRRDRPCGARRRRFRGQQRDARPLYGAWRDQHAPRRPWRPLQQGRGHRDGPGHRCCGSGQLQPLPRRADRPAVRRGRGCDLRVQLRDPRQLRGPPLRRRGPRARSTPGTSA